MNRLPSSHRVQHLEVKDSYSKSWFDHRGAKYQLMQLNEKLTRRCEGMDGVFITLTYRRDGYESPRDLYHQCQQQKHVPYFIRRLGKMLGEDFKGRWLSKMEFQEGGWIHFHLLILGIDYIKHSVLWDAWGHGYVFINRMTPKRIGYFCKYVSKEGAYPSWVYGQRLRSMKVIRVSPGFWGHGQTTPSTTSQKKPPLPFYLTIGHSLDRHVGYCRIRDENGRYRKLPVSAQELRQALIRRGAEVGKLERGWVPVVTSWREVEQAVEALEQGGSEEAGSPPGGSAARGALYLTDYPIRRRREGLGWAIPVAQLPSGMEIPLWAERIVIEQLQADYRQSQFQPIRDDLGQVEQEPQAIPSSYFLS